LTPLVSITTDISFDHMDILGDTLEKIAAEKGGIIKPGVPHLIGLLPKPAEQTLRQIAEKQKAPLSTVGDDRISMHSELGTLDYQSEHLKVRNLRPSLVGEHQLKNAAVALGAIEILKGLGWRLPVGAVRGGITNTRWRGRFQVIAGPRKPTIILDVCHNAAGAKAFAKTFAQRYPGQRVAMIVGFVQKKEHQLMFDALSTVASEYLLVPLKTHRSIQLVELMKQIDFRGVPARPCRSLDVAWATLVKPAQADDIIPVVGSHYLVGEYLGRYIKA
jgi:dihydrofolate synthase/folylpolyglutamate synthase